MWEEERRRLRYARKTGRPAHPETPSRIIFCTKSGIPDLVLQKWLLDAKLYEDTYYDLDSL